MIVIEILLKILLESAALALALRISLVRGVIFVALAN